MKPAHSRYSFLQPPQQWQDFPQGVDLSNALASQFNLWWPRIFGYHLLKVGNLSCDIDTSTCPIKHQIHLAAHHHKATVVADPDDFPFVEHAVDAVLLSHCLEYTQDPHHVIREAHRVLMPDGYLLLSGFNPLSMLGLCKLWPALHRQLPWSGRFFTLARVKDWLQLLGFEVIDEQRLFMSPLLSDSSYLPTLRHFAEHHLSFFGSAYVVVARKRTLPLTPIKPRWHLKTSFQPAVKGISARQGHSRESSEERCNSGLINSQPAD